MRSHIIATAVVLAAAGFASAGVFDDTSLLLKFDTASSGQVTGAGDIVDSSTFNRVPTNVYQTNDATLTWASVPATGPGGGYSVDPVARGLQFTPTLEQLDGGPNGEDVVNSAGFRYGTNVATGSATFATRFKWDGGLGNDKTYAWLLSNGHGNAAGWMIGINSNGGRIGQFQYNSGDFRSPTGFVITPGVWYDFAVVMLDDAEEGAGVDTLQYYLQAAGGQLQTATIFGTVNSTSSAYTNVGSESLSGTAGAGNVRKNFKGAVDFIATWDRGLSSTEVQTVFVPTPAALPAGLLLIGALAARRRR